MRRLSSAIAVVVLVATGLLVPIASANAATTVSASAVPRKLMRGETTRIVGYVRGAAPGSTVGLQLKSGDAWQRLVERATDANGAYSFTVKPPKGHPVYRVVLPRQGGQPPVASDPVTLTVRWKPTISLELAWQETSWGGRRLIASGATSYHGPGRIRLEQGPGDPGTRLGFLGLDLGTYSGRPARLTPRPGDTVRAVLGASGPRLRATATAVVPAPIPYHLTLNDPTGLAIPGPWAVTTVLVEASAGDSVSLSFREASVVAPDGTLVAAKVSRFEAALDGTYEITFSPDLVPATVYASTPKRYAGQWDDPLDIAPDLPGQVVEVVYDGAAGQTFTAPGTSGLDPGPEVAGPDGPLVPWLSSSYIPDVFRLTADTPVTYRFVDGEPHRVVLRSALLLDATVDGPHLAVDLPDPGAAAVVTLVVPDDREFLIDDLFLWGPLTSAFFGPDGADLQLSPEGRHYSGAGTYHLVVGGGGPSRTFAFATPVRVDTTLDADPVVATIGDYGRRDVWEYFSAAQGDIVSTYSLTSQGVIDPVRVEGPGGQSVPIVDGVVFIPETGEYRLLYAAMQSWSGQLGVRRLTVGLDSTTRG